LLAQGLAQEAPKLAISEPSESKVSDPGLATVIDRWGALPEHVRLAILSLVETAK
jgi:hypothetical protein